MAEQNPVWNNMAVHPTWQKHSVERGGGGVLSSSSTFLLQEIRKMET